ncbi:MAG: hypothetical protein LBV38_01070 [Alistipes sp.]|jgi:hypothetical protein|nr:hypothetical protein [Alistipes sp.]
MSNSNSILVFRTSINGKMDVKRVASVLNCYPQITHWSVDLEDWEKVLRIECIGISNDELSRVLQNIGIFVKELE